MWYTPQEQPFRFGLWTVANGALPVPFLIIYYGKYIASIEVLNSSDSQLGLGQVDSGPLVRSNPIEILEVDADV